MLPVVGAPRRRAVREHWITERTEEAQSGGGRQRQRARRRALSAAVRLGALCDEIGICVGLLDPIFAFEGEGVEFFGTAATSARASAVLDEALGEPGPERGAPYG